LAINGESVSNYVLACQLWRWCGLGKILLWSIRFCLYSRFTCVLVVTDSIWLKSIVVLILCTGNYHTIWWLDS